MKRIVYIIMVLVALNSCNQKKEINQSEITKIDVYHIPFELLFPTQSDESSIRKVESYIIEDNVMIAKIKNQITNLSNAESNKFNKSNVYLLCDFYTKDEIAFTLMFDKNYIDVDGSSYNHNELLIDMLIKE